ncbi:MAG: hypothetical protein SPI30_08610 [Prevotella sp.]|nr:hypothetical protein [Prevotella sp.]
MSSRLSAAFAKGVAGYAEEERQRICRQSTEISREASSSVRNVVLRSNDRFGLNKAPFLLLNTRKKAQKSEVSPFIADATPPNRYPENRITTFFRIVHRG